MAKSYADKVREKMQKRAAESNSNTGGDPREWSPDLGTHRIRILPPVGLKFPKDPQSISEDDLFYNTFKFHWVPNSLDDLDSNKNGKFLWAPRDFDVDGKKVRCPICEAVDQWYSVGRAEKDDQLIRMGGALKLKRHFFLNVIRYTDEGPEFRILVDRTNEGKLVKIICATMGMPFFRDVEDNWVDKNSTDNYDPDRDYYDLVDVENGYDFKIVKEKTGNNPWDISFEKSFPIKKAPRALTDEELELMGSRVDLKTYIKYEESYSVVKAMLDKLLGEEASEPAPAKTAKPAKGPVKAQDDEDEDEEDAPAAKPAKAKPAAAAKGPVKAAKPKQSDDDESMEDMLNELD